MSFINRHGNLLQSLSNLDFDGSTSAVDTDVVNGRRDHSSRQPTLGWDSNADNVAVYAGEAAAAAPDTSVVADARPSLLGSSAAVTLQNQAAVNIPSVASRATSDLRSPDALASLPAGNSLEAFDSESAGSPMDTSSSSATIYTPYSLSANDNGLDVGLLTLHIKLQALHLHQVDNSPEDDDVNDDERGDWGPALLKIAERTAAKITDDLKVFLATSISTSDSKEIRNHLEALLDLILLTLRNIRQEFDILRYQNDVLNAEYKDVSLENALLKASRA